MWAGRRAYPAALLRVRGVTMTPAERLPALVGLSLLCLAVVIPGGGCPETGSTSSSSSSGGGEASSSSDEGTSGGSSLAASSHEEPSSRAPSSSAAPASSSSATSSSGGQELAVVYAHSGTNLFRLDVDTMTISDLGAFAFRDRDGVTPITGRGMTDLAVNAAGELYGCTQVALFTIDLTSLVALKVADLSGSFVGLTFAPVGFMEPDREVLVGVTRNATDSLWRIDEQTGASTLIGSFGDGWAASGDVVAILHDAMYATLVKGGVDHLARVNPATGVATIIGSGIGTNTLYGLGYWGGVLYGFNSTGKMVSIDRQTGAGLVTTTMSGVSFWGAGVTTIAKPADRPDGGAVCQCEGCLCSESDVCCDGIPCVEGRCEVPG